MLILKRVHNEARDAKTAFIRSRLDGKGERLHTIDGIPPELINPKPGCPFADRCQYCTDACREQIPEMRQVSPTHFVRCDRMLEKGVDA